MKRSIFLATVLSATWLLWSGHFQHEPFVLFLGVVSVVGVVLLAQKMEITDDEGTPLFGLRALSYSLWLAKEIVIANLEVTKMILDPKLRIHPRMVRVKANQKTELGRVMLANSITLTPGTVSVDLQGGRIWVHALSFEDAEEDLSGDMDRRVCKLGV